jgi:hypothetical protein
VRKLKIIIIIIRRRRRRRRRRRISYQQHRGTYIKRKFPFLYDMNGFCGSGRVTVVVKIKVGDNWKIKSGIILKLVNFTLSEPCIVIHIRDKDQRDAHFFSLIYSN